jgi:hypothetical protein
MHRKTILKPYKLFDAQTLSASINSAGTNVSYMNSGVMQIIVGAGLTGQLYIETSNDVVQEAKQEQPTNWFDIGIGLAPLTGSAESYFIDFQTFGFNWLRIKYTHTSGSGVVTATIAAKEL